jgi:DNA-binding LytR/AlgR family response regulator
MLKIKTLIVDDEPHAIEIIERYIGLIPEIELVGKCNNAIQAFQELQRQKVDLLFLDVKMPGLLGTDLIRSLQQPPGVIFTTAYAEYALEGYDLNIIDYLLKPVPLERFLKAVDKVFAFYKMNPSTAKPQQVPASKDTFLYFRMDRKMIKVNASDIYWIESQKDYIKVKLKDREITSKQKISTVSELLPDDKFVRIHRSFIVAIDKIESYLHDTVEIMGRELPVGRHFKEEFNLKMNPGTASSKNI